MIGIIEAHYDNVPLHIRKNIGFTCPNCKSILKCDGDDLTFHYNESEQTAFYTVTCPVCGETIYLY